MAHLNTVSLQGRLTRDPEVKTSSSGNTYAQYSIAQNYWDGKEEQTQYVDIRTFGKIVDGKLFSDILRKGTEIIVTGSLRVSTYDDKDGNKRKSISVITREISLTSGSNKEGESRGRDDRGGQRYDEPRGRDDRGRDDRGGQRYDEPRGRDDRGGQPRSRYDEPRGRDDRGGQPRGRYDEPRGRYDDEPRGRSRETFDDDDVPF